MNLMHRYKFVILINNCKVIPMRSEGTECSVTVTSPDRYIDKKQWRIPYVTKFPTISHGETRVKTTQDYVILLIWTRSVSSRNLIHASVAYNCSRNNQPPQSGRNTCLRMSHRCLREQLSYRRCNPPSSISTRLSGDWSCTDGHCRDNLQR